MVVHEVIIKSLYSTAHQPAMNPPCSLPKLIKLHGGFAMVLQDLTYSLTLQAHNTHNDGYNDVGTGISYYGIMG